MNPQSKWPLLCVGTLAAGWLIGYVMGDGGSAAGGKTASAAGGHGAETMTLAPASTAVTPDDLPKATNDEEKHSESSILGALREPNDLRRVHDLYDAIGKMSPGEISSAITLAQRMTGQDRDTLLPMLVGKWAETDPQAALKFAMSLDRNGRFSATRAAVGVWASANSQAAMAWAQALPSGNFRNRVLKSVVENLGSSDVPAALRIIEQMPSGYAQKEAMEQITQHWASSDPQAAVQYVTALPPGEVRTQAIGGVAAVWARADAEAALAWITQLPEGELEDAKANVVRLWGENDPRAAADYLIKTDPAAEADDSNRLNSIAYNWAGNDPLAALAWARQIGDEKIRIKVLGTVIGSIADNDPQQAALLLTQLPAAKQGEATARVADTWAQSDPGAAAAWVMHLPESDAHKNAIRNVAERWAGQDLVTTASWLETLPAGPSRDAAVSGFIGHAAGTDPESAVAWASTIADPGTRNNDLERIARQWLRTDKTAAQNWINQTPAISAEMRQRLLPKK